MDLKGINWVGHMYQKYETMLLEVEDDIYQDVVKYVENQVQTVGDSVKKFYSDVVQDLLPLDVVQDLLPPSLVDPLQAGDSDLPVEKHADVCVYKKTKAGANEVPVKVDVERVMENSKETAAEVENWASSFHGSSTSSFADSLDGSCSDLYSTLKNDGSMHEYSNHDTKMNTEKKNLSPFVTAGAITSVEEGSGRASGFHDLLPENHEASHDEIAPSVSGCNEIENTSKHNLDVSVDDRSFDKCMLPRSRENKVTEVRFSSRGGLPAESNDVSSSHTLVSLVRSTTNGDALCCEVPDKEVIMSNSGTEDDSGVDEIKNKNVIEQELVTIQQSDHVKLEETCVVVNGDELHFVPQKKGKGKTCKKKIRDALYLGMKSSRKQEYEQLAVWYADEAGSGDQCTKSLKPVLTMEGEGEGEGKRSSPTNDVSESEWELL